MGFKSYKLSIIEDIITLENIKLTIETVKSSNDENFYNKIIKNYNTIKQVYDILLFKHKLMNLSYFILMKDLSGCRSIKDVDYKTELEKIFEIKNNLYNKLHLLHLNEFEIAYIKKILKSA